MFHRDANRVSVIPRKLDSFSSLSKGLSVVVLALYLDL